MGFVPIYQGDDGPPLAPEPIAKARRQLQTPGSSADDNDMMPIVHEEIAPGR
jgi:hypothetical protein